MIKPVYQHCPLNRLENRLVRYKEMKTPLELYIPGDALDDWKNNGVREQIIRLTQSYNPSLTLHGPIYGFDPAMRDKAIQELAWSRTLKTFEIAELTHPEVIVFHSSYNDLPYSMHTSYWIDQTTAFWEKAVHQRPNTDLRLVIENIFDVNPVPLSTMLKNVNHEKVGFCFDMGHFNLFGQTRTLPDYLSYFKGLIGHVHIHDNNGKTDQHLPPGLGTIDFDPLIAFLKTEHQPWSLTVEGKTFDHNQEATNFVRSNFPLFTSH